MSVTGETGILDIAQLTGRSTGHVVVVDGVGLHPGCREAFEDLQARAVNAGFDLQIASGFRSFDRQLGIWNGKARGLRPVHDDAGAPVPMAQLDEVARVEAILRFSALPGASRHHWGTDLDIFDAAAMPEGYQLQLTPGEWAEDGLFGELHRWLTEELAVRDGFFRPYNRDRGGVAEERWHLSYAPLARACEASLSLEQLAAVLAAVEDLALAGTVLDRLPAIYERFIRVDGHPEGSSL